jgi:hypothetical protein
MFTIKQHNTLYSLEVNLSGTESLVGSQISFSMMDASGKVVISEASAQVVDLVERLVSYDWTPQDTSVPGQYRGEFKVIFQNGGILTFPNRDYIPIQITKAIP